LTDSSSGEAKTISGTVQGSTSASDAQVSLVIPAGAVNTATTFTLAPSSSTSEVTDGYLVVKVSAKAGVATVTNFLAPIQINLPTGAPDGVLAWSTDGNVWFQLTKLTSLSLPANLQDGYFVNANGTISILTRHFTLFGWRKPQSALSVSASSTTVQLGLASTISASGGTGTGALKYATNTASLCSVSDAGVVTALAAGTCQITVTKWATLNLLSASQSISLTISDSDAKAKADADAKAKADADAKAKADADAKAKADADAKAKADADAKAKASRVITVGSRTNGKTPVRVFLSTSVKGQIAILQRAKPGQGFTLLFTRVLDSKGNALFQVATELKSGDRLRVRVGGKTLGSIVIP
jgi:predicted  nucleic acid-binding Zn-ribbon protein